MLFIGCMPFKPKNGKKKNTKWKNIINALYFVKPN